MAYDSITIGNQCDTGETSSAKTGGTILHISNLHKQFTNTKALDGVTFDVRRGSICGILGPNGAGKTTLLRIINGILAADSGTVEINGEAASLSTSRMLGYMPEERGLYDKMRVIDQIMYFGQLKGGIPKELRKTADEYLKLFNLTKDKHRRIKELSKGNQQKVQIISTIVHKPELVILDEPFSGFDPINGAILQELIERLHVSGATIILSSHNMPAIEEMCSDIMLIDHGHLLLAGTLEDIKESHKQDSLLITTREALNLPLLTSRGLITEATPTQAKDWRKGHAYRLHKAAHISNADVVKEIALQGDILHLEEELPSLKDIFIKYTTLSSESSQGENKDA